MMEKQREITSLRDVIAQLERQLNEEKEEAARRAAAAQRDADGLRIRIAELEGDAQAEREERERLERQLANETARSSELMAEDEVKLRRISDLTDQIQVLSRELNERERFMAQALDEKDRIEISLIEARD